ncbi:Cilia- and flagella-associated protein 57, partial [Cladochytrium tenue]
NLACHAWLSETRIVAGTDDAKLLIFDGGDLLLEIPYAESTGLSQTTPPSFRAVLATPSGGAILAGTSTGACVLFERADDHHHLYRRSRAFVTESSPIRAAALSPAGDQAVCTLDNGQIYAIPLDADSSKVPNSIAVYFIIAY